MNFAPSLRGRLSKVAVATEKDPFAAQRESERRKVVAARFRVALGQLFQESDFRLALGT